jgi:hypothetical protein
MAVISRQKGIAAAALFIICAALLAMVIRGRGGDDYDRRDLTLDSPEAQEAIAVTAQLAENPRLVPQYMSAAARENARAAVRTAADAMAELRNAEPIEAAWFGDYLRLRVACEREDADTLELRFLFRREDGELRLTGMQQ